MQRIVVETHLDALFATMNAVEANSIDAFTEAQIDQFRTSKHELLDVLHRHRPFDFRAKRVQEVLDKITNKLHR